MNCSTRPSIAQTFTGGWAGACCTERTRCGRPRTTAIAAAITATISGGVASATGALFTGAETGMTWITGVAGALGATDVRGATGAINGGGVTTTGGETMTGGVAAPG